MGTWGVYHRVWSKQSWAHSGSFWADSDCSGLSGEAPVWKARSGLILARSGASLACSLARSGLILVRSGRFWAILARSGQILARSGWFGVILARSGPILARSLARSGLILARSGRFGGHSGPF